MGENALLLSDCWIRQCPTCVCAAARALARKNLPPTFRTCKTCESHSRRILTLLIELETDHGTLPHLLSASHSIFSKYVYQAAPLSNLRQILIERAQPSHSTFATRKHLIAKVSSNNRNDSDANLHTIVYINSSGSLSYLIAIH